MVELIGKENHLIEKENYLNQSSITVLGSMVIFQDISL